MLKRKSLKFLLGKLVEKRDIESHGAISLLYFMVDKVQFTLNWKIYI